VASVDGRGSSDRARLPSGAYAGSDAYDRVIEGQFPLIWLFPFMHRWDFFFRVIVCLRGEGRGLPKFPFLRRVVMDRKVILVLPGRR
jgi:hypothetical protein